MNAIKAKGIALAALGIACTGLFGWMAYLLATDPHPVPNEDYIGGAAAAFSLLGLIVVRKGMMQFKTGIDYRVLDKERRAQKKKARG